MGRAITRATSIIRVTAPAGLVSASTCSSLVSTDSQPGLTLPAMSGMAAASSPSRSCTSRITVPPAGPGSKLTVSSVSKDGPCRRRGPMNPHRNTSRRSAASSTSSQSKPPTITPSSAFQVRQAPPARSSISTLVTSWRPGAIHRRTSPGSSHAR